jgi:hypothetical protein
MRILFRREHAQNVVIFMDRFTIVTSFLFVPPIAVGVAKLALHAGWVDVASILQRISNSNIRKTCRYLDKLRRLELEYISIILTISGSSISACVIHRRCIKPVRLVVKARALIGRALAARRDNICDCEHPHDY